MAAKEIFIQSQVAAMAALAPPPIGLGPVLGVPLAASIATLGKVSAGLTLASGALSIGQTLSGGDGGGIGGASPVFQADQTTGLPSDTGQITPGGVVNLSVSGTFTASDVSELVNGLNEFVADGGTLNATAVIS